MHVKAISKPCMQGGYGGYRRFDLQHAIQSLSNPICIWTIHVFIVSVPLDYLQVLSVPDVRFVLGIRLILYYIKYFIYSLYIHK